MYNRKVTALEIIIGMVAFFLIPMPWVSTASATELKPMVSILSPAWGVYQKGEVKIIGLATPNPSSSSEIELIGIKVVGLESKAENYFSPSNDIFSDFGGIDRGYPSWEFGDAGISDGVWLFDSNDGRFGFSWKIDEWPAQTYEITLFAKDFNGRTAASKPIQIVKEKGPISTVKANLSCRVSGTSYVGIATDIYCESEIELPRIPIQLQFNSGSGWKNVSGENSFEGESGQYQLLFKEGSTKIRATSPGLMKQTSTFYANTQVRPFISNVVTVKTSIYPKGKVDKKSREYKTMFTVGQNFASVSMATDSAMSQCKSAMSTGLIKARGIPQYLGVQARQIQSYLRTPSGFQGCIDGFNS